MNTSKPEVIEELAVCLQGGNHETFSHLHLRRQDQYRQAARTVLQRLMRAQNEATRSAVLARLAAVEQPESWDQ